MIWNTVKYFLDENQVRKTQITSQNTCPALLEIMAPNQLEEKFGGTAKNREEGQYWPPSCNDDNFGVGGKSDLSNLNFDANEMVKIEVPNSNEFKDIQDMP